MTMTIQPQNNQDIIYQAAKWAEELDHDQMTAVMHQSLADWLLAAPEHVRELLLATALFEACGEVDPDKAMNIEQLLTQKAPDVIPLLTAAQTRPSGKYGLFQNTQHLVASLAAVLVMAMTGFFMADPFNIWSDSSLGYATITGEQRSIQLDDGSVIHMNTATEIQIFYTRQNRDIRLLTGEAIFQVAHDPTRPFRVRTGTTTAQALGTVFNVYRQEKQTTVSVIKGRVAVAKTADSARPITIAAGEQAQVRPNQSINTDVIPDLKKVTAWRDRKLVFDQEELQVIIAEYNRYNLMKIMNPKPEIAQLKISGVFAADDPNSLIKFLERTVHVTAVRTTKNKISLKMDRK